MWAASSSHQKTQVENFQKDKKSNRPIIPSLLCPQTLHILILKYGALLKTCVSDAFIGVLSYQHIPLISL